MHTLTQDYLTLKKQELQAFSQSRHYFHADDPNGTAQRMALKRLGLRRKLTRFLSRLSLAELRTILTDLHLNISVEQGEESIRRYLIQWSQLEDPNHV